MVSHQKIICGLTIALGVDAASDPSYVPGASLATIPNHHAPMSRGSIGLYSRYYSKGTTVSDVLRKEGITKNMACPPGLSWLHDLTPTDSEGTDIMLRRFDIGMFQELDVHRLETPSMTWANFNNKQTHILCYRGNPFRCTVGYNKYEVAECIVLRTINNGQWKVCFVPERENQVDAPRFFVSKSRNGAEGYDVYATDGKKKEDKRSIFANIKHRMGWYFSDPSGKGAKVYDLRFAKRDGSAKSGFSRARYDVHHGYMHLRFKDEGKTDLSQFYVKVENAEVIPHLIQELVCCGLRNKSFCTQNLWDPKWLQAKKKERASLW